MDETLEIEELSTEDKKKAINLQDLIYVKKYIDDRHYSKADVDTKIVNDVATETTKKVTEAKEEFAETYYNKKQIDDNNYTKTQADQTFYKRTDTVANATNAVNATNSTYAEYASNDTSKGTIEERLTSLGFKQGSITLPSGCTVIKNVLTRQGNYVIGELLVSVIKDFSGPSSETGYRILSGNISDSKLYPKTGGIEVPASIQFSAGGVGDISVQAKTYAVIEDGEISVYLLAIGAGVNYVYIRDYDDTGVTVRLNFGYEAKPL